MVAAPPDAFGPCAGHLDPGGRDLPLEFLDQRPFTFARTWRAPAGTISSG